MSIDLRLLQQIIEATSLELALIDAKGDEFLERFKNARRSYFLNDLNGLQKNLIYFEGQTGNKYATMASEIFKVRLIIRYEATALESKALNFQVFNASQKYIESFNRVSIVNLVVNSASDPLSELNPLDAATDELLVQTLLVELLAVEAICHDMSEDYQTCFDKNKKASALSLELGMKIKASVLNYNGIVALNHTEPSNLRICHLTEAARLAESVSDVSTQVAALTSLAQEYEALGCLSLAFEESIKALEIAKVNFFGSFNLCYGLITSARLGAQVGRLDLAHDYLKLAQSFGFNELAGELTGVQELVTQKTNEQSLSVDEQKIVRLLTDGPKSKYFLIDRLYGSGEPESLENRFKQLLLRLRKKKDNLISYNKQRAEYELQF